MKATGVLVTTFLLVSCAGATKLTAADCSAKYDALRAKADRAWAQADPSDSEATAAAAEVSAQIAQDAADLSNGPCRQFGDQRPMKGLKL